MDAGQRGLVAGLYMGDYSYLSGLWRHWVPILNRLNVTCIPLWDRSFLSDDVLKAIDVLVVPGGFCWSSTNAFGGQQGRKRLCHAVRDGLSYVGVCYGANVAMASGTEKRICHLGLVEGRTLSHRTFPLRGVVYIDYDSPVLGYRATAQPTVHINGRLFGAGEYDILGRFSAHQAGPFETAPRTKISGLPAAVTAILGRGSIFLFASHPEIPIPYPYGEILDQVDEGKLSVDEALRRCWKVARVSGRNLRLLQFLFRHLPAVSSKRTDAGMLGPLAERAALLASAKELWKLKLAELEQNLVTPLHHAVTASLRTATKILERRLRQARHILGMLDPTSLWDSPLHLHATWLFFGVETLSCIGDHAGHIQERRMDFQVSEAKRIRVLSGKERECAERHLARLIVDRLDAFVQAGSGCVLR